MEESKRPWGKYKVLLDESYTKVKEITVNPKGRLSLQSHKHREEHWIVVQGVGDVTIGDIELRLYPGITIFIPKGAIHRIYNPENSILKFIEVQLGDSFDEDDIVRYEDDYNRA